MTYEVTPQSSGSSIAQIGLDFRRMSVLTKFIQQNPGNMSAAVNAWVANAFTNGYGLYAPAGNYVLDEPIIITDQFGFEMIGEGRNRTVFSQSQAWANQTYYDFDTAGCAIAAGSNQLTVPAATVDAFQDALTRFPQGPKIVVYGAGAYPNDRWETTYTAIVGNVLTCSANAPNPGTGIVRITPPALLDLRGVEQAQVHGFTINGYGSTVGTSYLWAGLRIGSVRGDFPPRSVPQRNHFFDLQIGGTCTALELFGLRDGNNDLSIIENSYFANVTKYGIDMMDSQQFDWTCRNITNYGDGDWLTLKVCSIAAGSNVLDCPSGPFKTFHVGCLIEVHGAGVGASVMPCFITRYISATQVEVSTNATVAVVGAAALMIGAQAGYHMGGPFGGGNLTAKGALFNGLFSRASMVDESYNGSNVLLSDGRDESCRALYEQPVASGIHRPVVIEGYTATQGAFIAERPVLTVTAGPFSMNDCEIGQPAAGLSYATICIAPTNVNEFVCDIRNTRIDTQLPRENVFSTWVPATGRSITYRPTSMSQVRIFNNAGTLVEYIDAEVRNEEAVTTATQPLSNDRVRITWGINESPDLSNIFANPALTYDASWYGAAPIQTSNVGGGLSDQRVTIPDRGGVVAAAAFRDFTPGDVNFKPPQLQAMGKNGRRAFRFDFGRALFIPPAIFAGMTEGEVMFVGQQLVIGGGLYALGLSSEASFPVVQPFTDNIYYEDAFRFFREQSVARNPLVTSQVMIINVISRATATPGDFEMYVNGTRVINAGNGNPFHIPLNPVFGAGGNNAPGTSPNTYGTMVCGALYVNKTVIASADRAVAIDAMRQYWGEGTIVP